MARQNRSMPEKTSLLHLEALPPQTTKGTIVRLLEQVGQLDKLKIGVIELKGRTATVEVPEAWRARLVKLLDGASVGNKLIRAWSSESASDSRSTRGPSSR